MDVDSNNSVLVVFSSSNVTVDVVFVVEGIVSVVVVKGRTVDLVSVVVTGLTVVLTSPSVVVRTVTLSVIG